MVAKSCDNRSMPCLRAKGAIIRDGGADEAQLAELMLDNDFEDADVADVELMVWIG